MTDGTLGADVPLGPDVHAAPDGRPVAVVAVAASAGGVEALTRFTRALPADLDATVLIVLHLAETGPSVLADILRRDCPLEVVPADETTPLRPRLVVVAQPGRHLRVRDGVAAVDRGPRVNGHRPSADVLFQSAAEAFGRRAAGVVLSGTMDDGAVGLRAIGHGGGLTVVQDPDEAAFPGMPNAAIAEARPALVCRVAEMGEKLAAWTAALGPGNDAGPGDRGPDGGAMPADLTKLTCPECGGSLWVHDDFGTERFQCRVGHTFSTRSLLAAKLDAAEAALWAAIVALEERADISRRLLQRSGDGGRSGRRQRYRDDVALAAHRIEVLRNLIDDLVEEGSPSAEPDIPDDQLSEHGQHPTS